MYINKTERHNRDSVFFLSSVSSFSVVVYRGVLETS